MFKKKIIFFVFLSFSLSIIVKGQNKHLLIEGVIKWTNKKNSFASIEARNDSCIKSESFGYSFVDSIGRFNLSILFKDSLPQNVCLYITSIGYVTRVEKINILNRALIKLPEIVLFEDAKQLPDIYVKYKQLIKQKGDTTEFDASAFKKINQDNIGDLVKNIPGFSFDTNSGKIIYNEKIIERVLIEGQDLYEKNYSPLIQNLSTNGIQNIQVIKNRKNDESLSSLFSGAKEDVLNINYNNNKKIRLYGSSDLKLSFSKAYSMDANMIALLPKIKMVAFNNENNIGKTENAFKGRDNLLYSTDMDNNIELNYPMRQSFAIPYKIANSQLSPNLYNFNKSSFTSSLTQWSKNKISIKNKLDYGYDKSQQYIENTQYYFLNNTITNTVFQNDTLLYKNIFINEYIKAKYHMTPRQEILYSASIGINRYRNNKNETINNTVNKSLIHYNLLDFRQNIEYNHLLGKKDLLSFFITHGYEKEPEELIFGPQFGLDNYSELYNFNQYITKINRAFSYRIRYSKRKNGKSYSLEIGKNRFEMPFHGNIITETLDENKMYENESVSDKYITDNFYLKGNINLSIFHNKGNISFAPNISKENRQFVNNNIEKIRKIVLLGDLKIDYKLAENKLLFLNLNSGMASLPIQMAYPNSFFENNTTYISGNDSLFIKNQYNINVSYSDIDLFRKKRMFFISYILQSSPVYYLDNLINNGIYNFQNAMVSTRRSPLNIFSLRLEKLFSSIESRFILSNNASYLNNYTMLNYREQKNTIYINDISAELKSFPISGFHIDLYAGWKYSVQNVNNERILVANNFQGRFNFEIKPVENIILNIIYEYMRNSSNYGHSIDYSFLDFRFDYKISQKIGIKILGNNIFNNKTFFSNSSTNYSYSYNSIKLRRILVGGLIYNF
ncbi:MAG: hypothetical protein QM610_01315 [Chitinophagaceae bacterium]